MGFAQGGSFSRQPSLRSQMSNSPIVEEPPLKNNLEQTKSQGACANPPNTANHTSEDKDLFLPLNQVQDEELKPWKVSSLPSNNDRVLHDLSDRSVDLDQRTVEQSIQINRMAQQITFLHKRLEILDFDVRGRYCFGDFLWKIENFKVLCEDMCHSNQCVYSNPFYSKPNEYKFCLRMNIQKEEGEHYLTLNIHMLQGENDNFLDWPFNGTIILSLLDCGDQDQKQNFTEYMETSPELSAFQKPKTKGGYISPSSPKSTPLP